MTEQKRWPCSFRTGTGWVGVCLVALVLSVMETSAMSREETERKETGRIVVIDRLRSADGWRRNLGKDGQLELSVAPEDQAPELCMGYAFGDSHSHALIAKDVPLALPEHFEFRLRLKRSALENHLELKLIDEAGNTFMKKWYSFGSVGRWVDVTIGRDDFQWAWGVNSSAPLDWVKTIEFGLTGKESTGQVCLARFELVTLSAEEVERGAAAEVNGLCPRWLSNQQAYWTMVGAPDDESEALFCEDGAVEPLKRGPAVLPVLCVDDEVVTREDALVSQSMLERHLPIPSVKWMDGDVEMDIELLAAGPANVSSAYAKYSVCNKGTNTVGGKLLLLIQPYQVYPPWQGGGGFSAIRDISYSNGVATVNGARLLCLPQAPDDFCVSDENSEPGSGVATALSAMRPFESVGMTDTAGMASGTVVFDFELEAGEIASWYVIYPLHPDSSCDVENVVQTYAALRDQTAAYWRERVGRVDIQVDEPDMMDVFKANVAYNLITKDGPALQPGSRSYDKAWMRDGAIAAVALLEAGETNAPRAFIEWFAGFQYDTGEIPPIIDTKAEDPLWEEKEKGLIEYDSQGEFIWTVMQYYNFTHDRAFLERMFPHVLKSLQFMVKLRSERLSEQYADPESEEHIFYGILPKSTSHEGYDLKHSYWDDYWGLKGWEDARDMAVELGKTNLLEWIDAEYAAFKQSVYDSVALVIEQKGIDYLPGCAELGDIDPTSSAAAIIYCNQMASLPQKEMRQTFERFAKDTDHRLKDGVTYRFTPYEMRTVAAYVRLGEREKALQLLRFMLKHCRPKAWNHLAEVAHSDLRYPCYIGDMPHTWVGAEYIHAVRTLFVYEDGDRLVLGAGVDPAWLADGRVVRVENLPTQFGVLSYDMFVEDGTVQVKRRGSATPPGGFVVKAVAPGER